MEKNVLALLCLLALFGGEFCQSASTKNNNIPFPLEGDETIPRKFKSIYYYNFINESYVGELTGEIRDILDRKMGLQKRFIVEPDKEKADILLYGKIEYYKLIPRDIDEFGRVTRYVMTAVVSIWVRPNPKISQENILDKNLVRFDTFYTPDAPPYESEFTARQRLVEGLCDRIVQSVLTGWYSKLKTNEELGYDPAEQKKLFGK